MSFTVHLAKEAFKFSAVHFTIFGAHRAERLHGHNYQVKCTLKVAELNEDLGLAFDFNDIKPLIKSLCDEFDEAILIAEKSPFLKLEKTGKQVHVNFGERQYQFPENEVRFLPVANITSEELARLFTNRLWSQVISTLSIRALSITIEETRGQAVTYTKEC